MVVTGEANYHFKQVLSGATAEIAVQFGEALLAVDAQRRNAGADAPALLRKAWHSLARHIVTSCSNSLTPQQALFLLSGAVGDTVVVKATSGERVQLRLLDTALYEALLQSMSNINVEAAPSYVLTPQRRMSQLAQQHLEPLDLNKPGRYREPSTHGTDEFDIDDLRREMLHARESLQTTQRELKQATRRLTDSLRAETLSPVLKEVAALGQLASHTIELADDPLRAASATNANIDFSSPAMEMIRRLEKELSASLADLGRLPSQLLQECQRLRSYAQAINNAFNETGSGKLTQTITVTPVIGPEALPRIVKDFDATNNTFVQVLQNAPSRTPWSACRVLLQEQFEKHANPLDECFATPGNVAASISKIDKLHPNCFAHDSSGAPLLPPVIIEPGTGVVRWMDDRFVLSFVCTETARPGKELSLSPVDIAVMQLFGLFLARGDLFNYRGERVFTNFMGEYAGEVESKAAVKFTGAEKKLTIVSASSERDSASREDAVRDYIDFIYCVFNGLPIPKRISARKISVFLKYCTIGSVERTAMLVLRHIVSADFQMARELLNKLAERSPRRLIALVDSALHDDVQLAARYRRDTRRALEEVMGREWLQDAVNAGHFDPARPSSDDPHGVPSNEPSKPGAVQAPAKHDYFDV